MKRPFTNLLMFAIAMAALAPYASVAGQRGKVVVRHNRVVVRHPAKHTKLVVRPGYPIHRKLPATVVVRPARRAVVVGAPLVYLPALVWTAATVSLPAGERLRWQDVESISRDEGWVDTNFGVDSSGNALFLEINGRAQLNFAEVTFANGNVQAVDFNDRAHTAGIYKLLDFSDGRHVKTVRILARSETDESKLTVYLSKG